ncbi:MAG: TIGR00725 family protein [Thermoplasmata archaeon]|nr:MAG: TIGR00725 family protein [Thermoplasmata archaeon]MCD6467864.1 TIGR00725 family protein [Thermoplasmata archaeon]RLF27175.1 MAG: TIGR00725 family protein [Thermoplasmata archaeon]
MRPLIAVCGSDYDDAELTEKALNTAEKVGEEIAKNNAILICGGRGGVMEAACRGAKKENGTTIGILPFSKEEANPFVDVVIPTGIGHLRNFIIVKSADAVIAVCGRWGTLNEISIAMELHKPLILIKGTGGAVDEIINHKILEEVESTYHVVETAEKAVKTALELIG